MFKKLRNENGFDYYGTIIVLSVLGIITSITIPAIFDYLNNRNNGDPLTVASIKTIKIERLIRTGTNPSITIACENAVLELDKRRIVIERLKSINGTSGSEYSWVVEMKVVNLLELLYIYLDKDAPYNIVITEKNKEPQKFFVDKEKRNGRRKTKR